MDFDQVNNTWVVSIEYYDDANPDKRIPSSLSFPINSTRAQAIAAIQAKGQEIRSYATINTAAIIGSTIPIP